MDFLIILGIISYKGGGGEKIFHDKKLGNVKVTGCGLTHIWVKLMCQTCGNFGTLLLCSDVLCVFISWGIYYYTYIRVAK